MPRQRKKLKMWFDYPDDPDNGKLEICNLDSQDIAAITAAAVQHRTVYDTETRTTRPEQIFHPLLDRQETAVRCITDWQDFYDEDGKPMPCTAANKRQWACDATFMTFVNKSRQIVDEKFAEAQADLTKN